MLPGRVCQKKKNYTQTLFSRIGSRPPSVSLFPIGSVVVIPIYIYWTRDSFQHSMLQARIRTKHSRMRLEPSEPQNSGGGGEAFLHTYAHTNIMERKKKCCRRSFFVQARRRTCGDRGRAVDIRDTHNAHTHTLPAYAYTRMPPGQAAAKRRSDSPCQEFNGMRGTKGGGGEACKDKQ